MEMPWRPYGDCGVSTEIPRSAIAFLRSSSWRSTVRSRRAHGVSTACTPRVRSGHRARTAHARRPHHSCHFAPAFASCYVCQLLFMSCHTSTHIMLSCQGTEPAAELKYNFRYSRCFFAAVLSRLEPLILSTYCPHHTCLLKLATNRE